MLYVIDPRKWTGHYGAYPAPVARAIVGALHRLANAFPKRVPNTWAYVDAATKRDTFFYANQIKGGAL